MLFFKEKLTVPNFIQSYLDPILTTLIQTSFEVVENIIKSGAYNVDKTEQAIRTELAIWIYHTINKLPYFQKLCNLPNSTIRDLIDIEILRLFFQKFGNGQNFNQFVTSFKNEFNSKTEFYQKLEVAFSESQILERDLEATYLVNIAGVDYNEIMDSSTNEMSKLHRMVVFELNDYLSRLASKFKITV